MPRRLRCSPGGYVYHVLNRAVGRATLFHKPGDYAAFENVLAEAADERPMRLLAYRLMPNHWHLVLWPDGDHDLGVTGRPLTRPVPTRPLPTLDGGGRVVPSLG
jgi:putative transposase